MTMIDFDFECWELLYYLGAPVPLRWTIESAVPIKRLAQEMDCSVKHVREIIKKTRDEIDKYDFDGYLMNDGNDAYYLMRKPKNVSKQMHELLSTGEAPGMPR